MEKVIKKASVRILAVMLAFLMVVTPSASVLGELGLLSFAAGDDSEGVIHTNTSYSNTDFSVVAGIAVVGSGIKNDTVTWNGLTVSRSMAIEQKLSAALRDDTSDSIEVNYYESLAAVGDESLVIYACGTLEAVGGVIKPAKYEITLKNEVENLKKAGKDVLLVTPGPVVAYGDGMIYDTDNQIYNDQYTPSGVAIGDNVNNAVSKYVDTIESVASSCNVDVLSIAGKAALFGVDEYMKNTADGVYPASYDNYVMWLAEYVSENYVIAATQSEISANKITDGLTEKVFQLSKYVKELDAVVITVPSTNRNTKIPENISVQTAKDENDQWFEATAKTKQNIDQTNEDTFSCALVFGATSAQYVRISADTEFPSGTEFKFYQTRLASPVITNPINGQALNTTQAFNIEWSAVANADRYVVTIMSGDAVVKQITTSSDMQAFPAGTLEDGVDYTVTVQSVGSGYFSTNPLHGSTSNKISISASKNAPLVDSSESLEEDVSAGKLVTLGEVSDLTLNADGNHLVFQGDTSLIANGVSHGASFSLLTDGKLGSFTDMDNTFVCLTDGYDGNPPTGKTATLTLDLGASYQLSSISFDTAFLVANSTANGAPVSVKFSYSNKETITSEDDWSAPSDFYTTASARTISYNNASFPMVKYLRTTDAVARHIKIDISLSQAQVYRNLLLDEIIINGYKQLPGVVVRDGSYRFNSQIVGAHRYSGVAQPTQYSWITSNEFAAVAPKTAADPIELVIDLNHDKDYNEISSGDHLVTSLNIGYFLDTATVKPSSVTVAVQKEEDAVRGTWTTVGGKVYTDTKVDGTFVDEHIELTNADASDVYASKVKITVYTNETFNNGLAIPETFNENGYWGTWLALSYIKLVGGQYIGSIEPDGATAAYHANFLQNTDLIGRKDEAGNVSFGDVNTSDIWNSIAWKSAGYKVSNSGYSEANGNITIGKDYWASEVPETTAPTPGTTTQTPNAVNPDYNGSQTAKADLAIKTITSYTVENVKNASINSGELSTLNDGSSLNTTVHEANKNKLFVLAGTGSYYGFEIELNNAASVSSVILRSVTGNQSSGSVTGIRSWSVYTSEDGNSFQDAAVSISGHTIATWSTQGTGYYGAALKLNLSKVTNAKKVRVVIQLNTYLQGLDEIDIEGTAIPLPTVSDIKVENVTKDGYTISCIATPGSGSSIEGVRFDTRIASWNTDGYQIQQYVTQTINGRYVCEVKADPNKLGRYFTEPRAIDIYGQESLITEDGPDVHLESEAPVIDSLVCTQDASGKASFTVNITATDKDKWYNDSQSGRTANNGVSKIELYIDGNPVTVTATNSAPAYDGRGPFYTGEHQRTYTYTYTGTYGAHTVEVYATDGIGNRMTTPRSTTVTLENPDADAPFISNLTVNQAADKQYTVTFNVTDASPLSVVRLVSWKDGSAEANGTAVTLTPNGSGSYSYTFTGLDYATYHTKVYVTDNAYIPNSSNATFPDITVVDQAPPTVTTPTITDLTKDGFKVNATVSDNVGIQGVTVNVTDKNGNKVSYDAIGSLFNTALSFAVQTSGYGLHTVTVTATDTNGNSYTSASATCYVPDPNAPKISHIEIAKLSPYSFTVNWSAYDEDGELANVVWYYVKPDGTTSDRTTLNPRSDLTYSATVSTGSVSGNYVFHIEATDIGGNKSAPASITVAVPAIVSEWLPPEAFKSVTGGLNYRYGYDSWQYANPYSGNERITVNTLNKLVDGLYGITNTNGILEHDGQSSYAANGTVATVSLTFTLEAAYNINKVIIHEQRGNISKISIWKDAKSNSTLLYSGSPAKLGAYSHVSAYSQNKNANNMFEYVCNFSNVATGVTKLYIEYENATKQARTSVSEIEFYGTKSGGVPQVDKLEGCLDTPIKHNNFYYYSERTNNHYTTPDVTDSTSNAYTYGRNTNFKISGWLVYTKDIKGYQYKDLHTDEWVNMTVTDRSSELTSGAYTPYSDHLEKSGFSANIDTRNWPEGHHELLLRVVPMDGSAPVEFLRIKVDVHDTAPNLPNGNDSPFIGDNIVSIGAGYMYNLMPGDNVPHQEQFNNPAGLYHMGYLADGRVMDWDAAHLKDNAQGWLGWYDENGVGPQNLEITLDLASNYYVSQVAAVLQWGEGTEADPVCPINMKVSFSSDGINWGAIPQGTYGNYYNEPLWQWYGESQQPELAEFNNRVTHTLAYADTQNAPLARYIKFSFSANSSAADLRKTAIYITELVVEGTKYVHQGDQIKENLAVNGTYAYKTMLSGDGVDTTHGGTIFMPIDFEQPDYSTSDGGTNPRVPLGSDVDNATERAKHFNVYKKGKLNDGVFGYNAAGKEPYHWVGWRHRQDQPEAGITLTFDLGAEYDLSDVYFYNSSNGNQENAHSYFVTFTFHTTESGSGPVVNGTWTQAGTHYNFYEYDENGEKKVDEHSVSTKWKCSAQAPTGTNYRYVTVNMKHPDGPNEQDGNSYFYIDEVVINGIKTTTANGPDIETPYNWAHKENGGTYMGTLGTADYTNGEGQAVYRDTDGTVWEALHSGKLNDGDINVGTGTCVGVVDVGGALTVVYKLKNRVDVSSVKVYGTLYGDNDEYPSNGMEVMLADADTYEEALSKLQDYGTAVPTAVDGGFVGEVAAENQGAKFVFITLKTPSFITFINEIEIWGTMSAKLDDPIITSHIDGDEIGIITNLRWTEVTAPDIGKPVEVYYDVEIIDDNEHRVIIEDIIDPSTLLNNSNFQNGEGYYTITVHAKAEGGWIDGTHSINVYYADKFIIIFKADPGAIIKAPGQTANQITVGVYFGAEWGDQDVKSMIANIIAVPYLKDEIIQYFVDWFDTSNGAVGIPESGLISGNIIFQAAYATVDTTGTTQDKNSSLTDGKVYDGTGSRSDYVMSFKNDNQLYDYVIIDLGKEYYSLTEFDVSFYQVGSELPFQITLEVSSKVYVPTISQGAAFGDEDWSYVAIVQREDYEVLDATTDRHHFKKAVESMPVIDGAFGRYLKVTFYYGGTSCGGIDVDEIMVSGSDVHDRMNVADGNNCYINGGTNDRTITDGVLEDYQQITINANGDAVIYLESVKTGITSFELTNISNPDTRVDVYITASDGNVGDTASTDENSSDADPFVLVAEALAGTNGSYVLPKEVSARRIKFVFDTEITVSEIRVFADAGDESFYEATGIKAEVVLNNGTLSMDNVVSIQANYADLYALDANGDREEATVGGANGARGTEEGSALTDTFDLGYANGATYITTAKGPLWYAMYTSKRGATYYLNGTFVTAWAPTLGSTAVDFEIGSKIYKFEFNGDKDKGFVVLGSDSATPFSYSATRDEDYWMVEFTVTYNAVSGQTTPLETGINYSVTAKEEGAAVADGSTGSLTFMKDGQTKRADNTVWDYSDEKSSWVTIKDYTGTEVVAQMTLDKVYYGVNQFAISVLKRPSKDYVIPGQIRFQISLDGKSWRDVGYAAERENDTRYYNQYELGEAWVYSFSANFEGATAKYVRAVMTVPQGKKVAVQEFLVNAHDEPLKASGGDNKNADFDYKMLWDANYLYIALQYEESEVPFYTATHNYFETYSMVYDTAKWTTDGQTNGNINAFAVGNLVYDDSTGYFQLEHTITRPDDDLNKDEKTTNGYLDFTKLSTAVGEFTGSSESQEYNVGNIRLYKVNVDWNHNGADGAVKGHFKYSDASRFTGDKPTLSKTNYETPEGKKRTLAKTSVLNGYVIVYDGYALSQDIDGDSLKAIPIKVNANGTIDAAEINNEIVWFFEDSDNADFNATSHTLGDYLIYGFRYGSNSNNYYDNLYLDEIGGMMYNKYFLTRAYQGMLWENLYTFPRTIEAGNTLFNYANDGNGTGMPTVTLDSSNGVNNRTYNSAPDFNWNVLNDGDGNFTLYLKSQGIENYNNMLDDIDGASSFRLYMSVANLNDTARYDYGNYDFVLDTYVIDDNVITLSNGSEEYLVPIWQKTIMQLGIAISPRQQRRMPILLGTAIRRWNSRPQDSV